LYIHDVIEACDLPQVESALADRDLQWLD